MPHGVLGMLCLVIAVEHTLASHSDLFTELMPATWKYSATKARKEGRQARILCFGSSLVKFGVLPKVLEQEIGEPSFNLAVYGGRMASSYVLLKKSLEAGATLKAIVLDCHDGPVAPGKQGEHNEALTSNRDNWPRLLTWKEGIDIAWEAGDADFLTKIILAKTLTSLESRPEIRSAIVKGLNGEPLQVNPDIVAAMRNWNTNLGTQVMTPSLAHPAASAEELREANDDELKAGDWRPNPFLDSCFEKILKLTAAHRVEVFLVLPPLSPGVHINQDAQGQTVFYNELCRRAMRLHPNLVVVDARRSGYGWPEFHDKTHLNAEGALTFSHDLGKVIADHLDNASKERWVRLPRYRKSGDGLKIETFEQSRIAVGLLNTVRR